MTERYSVQVLRDCIELQNKKGSDYQNKVSTVKQADYYRLGVDTIYDIMHAKMLRMKSLLETARATNDAAPNFESLADSAKDLINYASFFAAYAEGKVDGQDPKLDMFNRPKKPSFNIEDIAIVATPSTKSNDYKAWSQIIASDEIEDTKRVDTTPTWIASTNSISDTRLMDEITEINAISSKDFHIEGNLFVGGEIVSGGKITATGDILIQGMSMPELAKNEIDPPVELREISPEEEQNYKDWSDHHRDRW